MTNQMVYKTTPGQVEYSSPLSFAVNNLFLYGAALTQESRTSTYPASARSRGYSLGEHGRPGVLLLAVFLILLGCYAPIIQADSRIDIKNVTVVDVINENVLENQRITIQDGKIVHVEPENETSPLPGSTIIDGSNFIAIPGFIDTHTHLWQHAARGVASAAQLQDWAKVVYSITPYLTSEDAYWITLAAASQALLSGTTSVIDFASMDYANDTLPKGIQALLDREVDGGVVLWKPPLFFPSPQQKTYIDELRKVAGERISLWMGFGPLSFFSVPTSYDGVVLAQKAGMPITEHTEENIEERRGMHKLIIKYLRDHGSQLQRDDVTLLNSAVTPNVAPSNVDGMEALRVQAKLLHAARCFSRDGPPPAECEELQRLRKPSTWSPVPILDGWKVLPGFIAIHGVWLTNDDVERFKKNDASVSYNPESNMYLASGVARLNDLFKKGVRVHLGTDGAASNDRIDMFDAMRTAITLQKVYNLDPMQGITPWKVLQMATIEGARAMKRDGQTGSITTGKEADITLVDKRTLGASPITPQTIVPLLVYSATGRNVDTVLSNGHIVVQAGKLQGRPEFSEPNLARELNMRSNRLFLEAKQGKKYDITRNLDSPRYWSVRKLDDVKETFVNNSTEQPLYVLLAFSGTLFGGNVPGMQDEMTRKRYPIKAPDNYWCKLLSVKPGTRLTINKRSNNLEYVVNNGGDEQRRVGPSTGSEQILVYPSMTRFAPPPGCKLLD